MAAYEATLLFLTSVWQNNSLFLSSLILANWDVKFEISQLFIQEIRPQFEAILKSELARFFARRNLRKSIDCIGLTKLYFAEKNPLLVTGLKLALLFASWLDSLIRDALKIFKL